MNLHGVFENREKLAHKTNSSNRHNGYDCKTACLFIFDEILSGIEVSADEG